MTATSPSPPPSSSPSPSLSSLPSSVLPIAVLGAGLLVLGGCYRHQQKGREGGGGDQEDRTEVVDILILEQRTTDRFISRILKSIKFSL